MSLPLKRIIDERFIRKDGTCIIYIQYCYSSTNRTLLSTEIGIPPAYWDYKEGYIKRSLPPEYGSVEELNTGLRRMYRNAEDIVLFINKKNIPDPGAYAKSIFKTRNL